MQIRTLTIIYEEYPDCLLLICIKKLKQIFIDLLNYERHYYKTGKKSKFDILEYFRDLQYFLKKNIQILIQHFNFIQNIINTDVI